MMYGTPGQQQNVSGYGGYSQSHKSGSSFEPDLYPSERKQKNAFGKHPASFAQGLPGSVPGITNPSAPYMGAPTISSGMGNQNPYAQQQNMGYGTQPNIPPQGQGNIPPYGQQPNQMQGNQGPYPFNPNLMASNQTNYPGFNPNQPGQPNQYGTANQSGPRQQYGNQAQIPPGQPPYGQDFSRGQAGQPYPSYGFSNQSSYPGQLQNTNVGYPTSTSSFPIPGGQQQQQQMPYSAPGSMPYPQQTNYPGLPGQGNQQPQPPGQSQFPPYPNY